MPLTILYDDGRTEEQVHYIEVGPSVKVNLSIECLYK